MSTEYSGAINLDKETYGELSKYLVKKDESYLFDAAQCITDNKFDVEKFDNIIRFSPQIEVYIVEVDSHLRICIDMYELFVDELARYLSLKFPMKDILVSESSECGDTVNCYESIYKNGTQTGILSESYQEDYD